MESVAALLRQSGLPGAQARALLASVLQVSRESLVAHPERFVADAAVSAFLELAARRRAGEPLAYLLGEREFYGRVFRVGPAVLIPRPETELVVERALAQGCGRTAPRVLDLGTGSGCIAISIALERPDAEVVAVDVSSAALDVARDNAARLGARVHFLHGDWFDPVEGRFDLIVANPPYIAEADPHLADLRHEPGSALVAAQGGLACLKRIIRGGRRYLSTNGWLIVEHGYDQAGAVRNLFLDAGFATISTRTDAASLERTTEGCAGQGSETRPRVG